MVDKNFAICLAKGVDRAMFMQYALKDFVEGFQKRNPHIRMFNAVIHLDEETPHVHIDFVPFATEQKRGTRISLTITLQEYLENWKDRKKVVR